MTRKIIESARRFDAGHAFGGLYELAAMRRRLSAVWSGADVMVVPTYPRPHTAADVAAYPVGLNSEFGTYTNFVNLLDLCALAVPGRPRHDRAPSGVTLIAPARQDALIAAIGERIHGMSDVLLGALGRLAPTPPERQAKASADEIEIAVVGAHLSGMPLNGEVKSRGGRFLRAVSTTASYRLYALPGKVARPGLLRVADNAGAAIETEVWALPSTSVGAFVSGIPSPLGIGTLRLADGSSPLGFLVAPEGVVGAQDITRFGGWRAYAGSTVAA